MSPDTLARIQADLDRKAVPQLRAALSAILHEVRPAQNRGVVGSALSSIERLADEALKK